MLNALGHMNHAATKHAAISAANCLVLDRLLKNRNKLLKGANKGKLRKPYLTVADFKDLMNEDHNVDRRSLMYQSLFTGYGGGPVVNSFDRVNNNVNNDINQKRVPLRWGSRYQTIQKMLDDQFMNLKLELMRIAAMENPFQ